jgi:hypothetical protein
MPANDATDLIHCTHGHDLKLGHTHRESNRKLLTCSLCDIYRIVNRTEKNYPYMSFAFASYCIQSVPPIIF